MKNLLLILFFTMSVQVFAGIPLSTNFTVNTALPIDDRMSIADTTARDAISSLKRWEGMLVYVIADGKHYTLIGGITNGDWTELSGGGGAGNLALWLTATPYVVGDTVIESNKIYYCLTAHTSGTFATDLAAVKWVEISAPSVDTVLGPATATDNAIARYDATTGKLIQNSTAILDDAGAMTATSLTLAGNISAYNYDKDNLLVNGNIENPLSSEWTCTVGTCTRTTTSGEFSKDTAALKVALSAQSMNVSQTVTTPSGIQKQGFVRVIYRVPATMADFQICSLVDAAEQTCIPTANLIKDDTFRTAEIPLTFGSTSAGIKFKTTSSYTATAYFDGAILAQGLGTQNLQGDYLYSALVDSTASVSQLTKPSWVSCTKSTPLYTCTFATGLFSVAPNCWMTPFWVSGVTSTAIGRGATTNSTVTIATGDAGVGDRSFTLACQKSGNDYLAASSSVYASQNANYGPTNAGTITITATTTPPTKGTIVTDRVIHSRFGNRMLAEYQYQHSTAGSAGTGDYIFTLPDGKSFDTAVVNLYTGDIGGNAANAELNKSYIGSGTASAINTNRGNCSLHAYSATQFRAVCEVFGISRAFVGTTTQSFGNANIGYGFTVNAPISGWTNSSTIVGSFENVPTVPGAGARIDTFSVSYGTTNLTTVCSGTPCFIDQIGTAVSSITRASTADYFLNTVKTYTKLKCTLSASSSSVNMAGLNARNLSCANCSSLEFITKRPTTETDIDSFGTISCMGSY